MPHVGIEDEIRARVDEFVERMTALIRSAILQTVAEYLRAGVDDISAAAKPVGGSPAVPRSRRAPHKRPERAAEPRKRAPKRAARAARSGTSGESPITTRRNAARKKGSAPSTVQVDRTVEPLGEAVRPQPSGADGAASPAFSSAVGDVAAELLAHVQIEPGQALEELAVAMGSPAKGLEEPLKKLLAENKIVEQLQQGQVSYYPA